MIREILSIANPILLSANVILGFSLFVYVFAHNFRSPVAQAFCALTAFVSLVFVVELGANLVISPEAVAIWLRLQWAGISLVPAAYLHFSVAVLRTTGATSRLQRAWVWASYLVGVASLVLACCSDLVVRGLGRRDGMFHLLAGPLFWLFAAYYVLTSAAGWGNILRAEARCLTTTSRRRMAYLKWAFAAPGIGVLPYLLIPATARILSANVLTLMNLAGNLATGIMIVVIGYIVAYQGVLLPDRVIKHNLVHFLLRGPLVAILVVALMLTVPRVEAVLGLPRDTVLAVTVVAGVVLLELFVNMAKPAIDRLIYRKDRSELAWIQSLDQRLLTSTDLEQILENTLIALCELLRVPSGFVVTMEDSRLSLRVFCGEKGAAARFLAHTTVPDLLERLANSRRDDLLESSDFATADGYWCLPLRARSERITLGILGMRYLGANPEFGQEDLEAIYVLVRRAEMALEDIRLQQRVFAVLGSLESEVDEIQQWRSLPRYAGAPALEGFESNPVQSPGFDQLVKDALNHYWGGPKLSQSPLLKMRIVAQRLAEMDNVPAKAVRGVLQQAIEMLKPSGERSLDANEWVVYNILDLRFIQGQRIRDIAHRLSMSESDYYRKQRVAIEQVADTLSQMERALDGAGESGSNPAEADQNPVREARGGTTC